jgi:hypothetical protein
MMTAINACTANRSVDGVDYSQLKAARLTCASLRVVPFWDHFMPGILDHPF